MSTDPRHLLIPIHVDALTVGGQASANDKAPFKYGTVNAAPDYAKLKTSYRTGAELRQNPMQLESGVHLHFRLPRVVAHGDLKKQPAFPRIPNRWLVQRFFTRKGAVSVKAWLVSSDKEALEAKDQASAVVLLVRPAGPASAPFTCRPTGVARVIWDPDKSAGSYDYRQDRARAEVELTAVTGGDAGFSAHYPACRSMLGCHDDLSDLVQVPANEPVKLSYLVTGWYSAAADDPWHALVGDLAGTAWDQLDAAKKAAIDSWLDERGCSTDFGSQVLPSGMLCHGLVEGVGRPGDAQGTATGGDPFAAFEDPHAHWVDLGNTSAETIAARAAKLRSTAAGARKAYGGDVKLLEDLISALQVGLFSQGVNAAEMDAELHRQSFAAVGGGKIWEIHRPADAQASDVPSARPAVAPPLPTEWQDALAALNQLESQCVRREALLRDYQWELYALWHRWTNALKRKGTNAQRQLRVAIDALKKFVPDFALELQRTQGQRDSAKAAVEQLLSGVSAGPAGLANCRLVERPIAPFYTPKDPVLLLTGPAAQQIGSAAQRSPVRARVSGQERVSLLYGRGDAPGQVLDAADVAPGLTPAYFQAIPPWSARLLVEALLLQAADTLTAAGNTVSDPGLPKSVPADDFSRFQWRHNPWIPLYLDWSVSWRADVPAAPLAQRWTLETRATDAGEYQRNHDLAPLGDPPAAPTGKKVEYKGLCFVGSPLFNRQFARSQRDAGAAGEETGDLRALLKQIDEVLGSRPNAMISQALAGLHDAFIMRRSSDPLPPLDYGRWADKEGTHPLHLDPIAEAWGPDFQPDSSPMMPRLPVDPPPPFSPLRSGVLQLDKLWVIDAFGQRTLIVHDGPANMSGRLAVHNQAAFRLRPRVCSPMRVDFAAIAGDAASAGSVCGWVVPNRFDQNLVLYTGDGHPVGILQRRFGDGGKSGRPFFYWVPVPGAYGAEAQASGIRNPHLQAFAQFVLGLGFEAGRAFDTLMSEAMRATEQRIPEDNPLIAVLLGRPLALVRAQLRFERAGLAALDQAQSWTAGLEPGALEELLATSLRDGLPPPQNPAMTTGGVEQAPWPVRLGDRHSGSDGLVGFFQGEPGASGFYPSWGFELGDRDHKGLERTQELELDLNSSLQLTLLMDPQARVHVTTGVLPRTVLELPSSHLKGLRQVREVFFQTAPVLGTALTPHVPTPSDDYGQWSWTYRPDVTGWAEDPNMISAAELAGPSVGWPTLSEGWLKLRTEPVLIKSLWIKAPAGALRAQTNVTLAWSLHGADTVELFELHKDGREESRQQWSTAPLGSDWTGCIKAGTVFRLRAANQAGWEDCKDIEIRIEE